MTFDYQSGVVFGLNFKQHDARKMRHVLKHYERLPANQGARLALFLRLQALETSLDEEVSETVKDWFENGGDLPPIHPVTAPVEVPVKAPAKKSTGDEGEGEKAKEDEEEGSDEESSSDSGVSAISGHELLWKDRERALRRNPGMDIFDLFPQHPDNPERDNYIFGNEPDNGEFGMEPNRTEDEDESSESEEESEEEDDEDEDEDEENEEDEEDDEEDEEDDEEEEEEEIEEIEEGPESGEAQDHFQNPPHTVECVICAEYVPIVDTLSSITGDCQHPDTFICKECLDLSITTDIEYGLLNGIKCPLCTAVLTDQDVHQKASLEVLDRYMYLREKASRPDTFILCLGPKCGGGQIHEGTEPLMICDHCQFKTCVKHKLPWHEGLSCDDFDIDDSQIERLEQEEATAKLLAKDSRICPQCKECVVRSDGCDHMECRCGKSWCYLCGVDWENIIRLGDSAHGRNCPNHPDSHKLSRGQILANQTALTNLVHGRPIDERQIRAKYAKQAARRDEMRPLALAAAEQRMKQQALEKSDSDSSKSGPPKKKTKLVGAWEEK
ncbi:hypothetical protein BOTCAL_0089g00250 [Botryotinia calthae]|uniref:RBR-type E3 ubiquitin transferase n=1 Tax=Botryotinia calthae TaxID=38488 RepID=A0A4Y8D7E0_9HELO|nr:hypothetical protein BOTCAL_0089g00250 [Botryotinia calthae]